uniref:Trypanosoma vivax n=1 Tax=Trypanosoma vivax (strain Y486) TaxID=1055687 RepID=G0UCL9_TRYVY|nr:Trypanosoma vivax [Trypanosoma vivax Y486]
MSFSSLFCMSARAALQNPLCAPQSAQLHTKPLLLSVPGLSDAPESDICWRRPPVLCWPSLLARAAMGGQVLCSIKAGACFVFRKTVRQRMWPGNLWSHFVALRGAPALSGALPLASGVPARPSAPGPRPIFGGVRPIWPKTLGRCVAVCCVPLLRGGVRPPRFSAFLWLLSEHAALPFSSPSACRRLAVSLPVAPRASRGPCVMKLISPLLLFAAGVSSLSSVSLFVFRVPPVFLFLGRCAEPSPALKTSRPGAVLIFAKSVPAPKNVAFERPEKITGQPCPMDFTQTLSRPVPLQARRA